MLKRFDCHFGPPHEHAHSTAAWAIIGSASVRPLKERQKIAEQPAFDLPFETECSPQFKVTLKMVFEISTGHA